MAPHAHSPPVGASERDLEGETQFYVRKMVENIKSAKALCPLDTPEKTDKATPFWNGFYEILSFTTLDAELEKAILRSSEIVRILPDIRFMMGEGEGALEVTYAERVAAAHDSTEGMTPSANFKMMALYTGCADVPL